MDVLEVKNIWNSVKDELGHDMPEHIFNTWVTPLEAVDYENSTLVLLSPHQMAVDILKKNWTTQIKETIRKVLGANVTFSLTYDSELAEKYVKQKKK